MAHCRKVQTLVGLANVAGHNSRVHVYEDNGSIKSPRPDWLTRPDRGHLNQGDMLPPEVILKRRGDRIRAAEAANVAEGQKWRKPQKNAAAGIEVSISASPDWFEGKNERQINTYFADCRDYLAARFGKENILHWATHYDETTPHMHVLLVPIVQTKDRGLQYSSSTFLGGRNGLKEFQDEIAAKVGAKHGLERGVEGSGARHTDQYQWAAETNALAAKLAAREAAIAAKEALAGKDVPPFEPKIYSNKDKGPYKLADGEYIKDWKEYAAREIYLLATANAAKLNEMVKGERLRAARYEIAATKTLPDVQKRLEALTAKIMAMTPDELRQLAKVREEAIERAQVRKAKDIER